LDSLVKAIGVAIDGGIEADSASIRVLVADDDPIVRSLMTAKLVEMGAIVAEAEDGAVALDLLDMHTFDLAIVDLMMPNVDGLSLIRRIRFSADTQNLPVIVISSHGEGDAVRNAYRAGASSLLAKPVDWQGLEHHVKFLMRMALNVRKERSLRHMQTAIARGKDAIIGRLCNEIQVASDVLLDTAESLGRQLVAGRFASSCQQILDGMVIEARSLRALVGQTSGLVETLSREIVVDDHPEPLAQLIEHAGLFVQSAARDGGIDLDVARPDDDVMVVCDGETITVAIVHLLRNAIAHSPPGSRVRLTPELFPDGMLAIRISDNGPGMTPEFVAIQLTPLQAYRRGDHTRGQRGGGFGLPLVKAIAEAHNGSLEIRSMPGEGTDAIFVLPSERVARNTTVQGQKAPPPEA
jgi:signal transduction histidine kinase